MTAQEAIDVLFNELKCIDRNDGIHCDRKCETCDLVMDVGIIREAFNMAISALQAQDSPKPTAESVQNVQNEDLISRKAAIEAMSESLKRVFPEHRQIAEKCLKALPSAQPDTKAQLSAEGTTSDLISRQEAIEVADAVWRVTGDVNVAKVWDQLKNLPSAQQETAKRIVGKSRNGMTLWYQCDMCNEPVDAQDNFCRGCGRRLTDG